MELYGYSLIGAGLALLIVCIFLFNFGLSKIAKPLALSAVGVVATGVALVYVGPWLAWIFAAIVALILLAVAALVAMNWRKWLTKAEAYTGWEIDGRPNDNPYQQPKD